MMISSVFCAVKFRSLAPEEPMFTFREGYQANPPCGRASKLAEMRSFAKPEVYHDRDSPPPMV